MAGSFTYNTVVVSPNPRGRFVEGILNGTPYPGVVLQLKASTASVGGTFTFEEYSRGADGDRPQGPLLILCEDYLQGRELTDQFTSGDQVKCYIPLPGDELMMRIQDVSGTADTFAIGDILMIDSGTGELIDTTGTPETESFVMMEAVSPAPTEDHYAHVWYSGY